MNMKITRTLYVDIHVEDELVEAELEPTAEDFIDFVRALPEADRTRIIHALVATPVEGTGKAHTRRPRRVACATLDRLLDALSVHMLAFSMDPTNENDRYVDNAKQDIRDFVWSAAGGVAP